MSWISGEHGSGKTLTQSTLYVLLFMGSNGLKCLQADVRDWTVVIWHVQPVPRSAVKPCSVPTSSPRANTHTVTTMQIWMNESSLKLEKQGKFNLNTWEGSLVLWFEMFHNLTGSTVPAFTAGQFGSPPSFKRNCHTPAEDCFNISTSRRNLQK